MQLCIFINHLDPSGYEVCYHQYWAASMALRLETICMEIIVLQRQGKSGDSDLSGSPTQPN